MEHLQERKLSRFSFFWGGRDNNHHRSRFYARYSDTSTTLLLYVAYTQQGNKAGEGSKEMVAEQADVVGSVQENYPAARSGIP